LSLLTSVLHPGYASLFTDLLVRGRLGNFELVVYRWRCKRPRQGSRRQLDLGAALRRLRRAAGSAPPKVGWGLRSGLGSAQRNQRIRRSLPRNRRGGEQACCLFALSTWLNDLYRVAPYFWIVGRHSGGKTTLLHALGAICHRPVLVGDITPASIYWLCASLRPTLLLDEFEPGSDACSRNPQRFLRTGGPRKVKKCFAALKPTMFFGAEDDRLQAGFTRCGAPESGSSRGHETNTKGSSHFGPCCTR